MEWAGGALSTRTNRQATRDAKLVDEEVLDTLLSLVRVDCESCLV